MSTKGWEAGVGGGVGIALGKRTLKRADNAKDYIVAKGIAAGRLTTQAYGADWAKAATTKGASEPKNRRVQTWVK